MSLEKNIALRKKRRKFRSKKALKRGQLPRVSVFRSLKHMYAQVVDDKEQKTIASSSTLALKDAKGDKIAQAHEVDKKFSFSIARKRCRTSCV